ncbi:MAG: biotin--[acetyl-CoA-carboxylase] ligase [Candidatus Aminicenantes bacterium]|nr:biotin--[acetyl-CoA-carboxylase] ligase [Candidatus Aminicenantes bacterium]
MAPMKQAMEFRLIRLKACGSTNDEARALARAGAAEGTVVVAEEQTSGRGTKGRSWHSPAGLGLYASLVLRPPSSAVLPLLPLAAGLAAREAVDQEAGLAAGLRWPNDIVFGGKKLGGILCETEFSGTEAVFAVVGLGLNLAHRPADFPDKIRDLAVSVAMAGGRVRPEALLEAYLAEIEAWVGDLTEGRPARLIRAFEIHHVLEPGDRAAVDTGRGVREGRYLGLADDGRIRLAFEEGEVRFASADIVRLE